MGDVLNFNDFKSKKTKKEIKLDKPLKKDDLIDSYISIMKVVVAGNPISNFTLHMECVSSNLVVFRDEDMRVINQNKLFGKDTEEELEPLDLVMSTIIHFSPMKVSIKGYEKLDKDVWRVIKTLFETRLILED